MSSLLDWIRKVIKNEHQVPEELRQQHTQHIQTLHRAVVAVEKINGQGGIETSLALDELRTLEAIAKSR